MNKISIVIVNYKVKHFLKQCLHSIQKASSGLEVEVWVVDNDSQDGSVEMIQQFFPNVKLVVNKINVGFSKANNQALRLIKTKYTLILNPDTVLSEDCLVTCFNEMEQDEEIGMIGVRMIDGTGTYLPESKRGFPTPSSSFYKLSGLYKFFPKSSYFNHYYLGHLPEFEKNEVEVLTGAFMFSRTELLHQVNYFDEDYFMYGEDIDLSTKIIQSGAKLIYLPQVSIIHFKGESTKKQSATYIKHFYNAMLIFTSKHFSSTKASIFTKILKFGVLFRGLLGFINQVVIKRAAVLIDFIIAFISLEIITKLWAIYYYKSTSYYEGTSIHYNNLMYSLLWCTSLYIIGHYGRKFKIRKLLIGILIGTGLIFILYALLDYTYNPSRAIIVLGMVVFSLLLALKQIIINFFDTGKIFLRKKNINKVLIAADETEIELIKSKLEKSPQSKSYIGYVQINNNESIHSLGTINQIVNIVNTYEINEVIFSLTHSKMSEIMPIMTQLGHKIQIKLTGGEHLNIIGSNSKNLTGEVYMMDIQYNIETIEKTRQKRAFDLIIGVLCIFLFPILKLVKNEIGFKYILNVVFGNISFIGYNLNDEKLSELPPIKKAIIQVGKSNYPIKRDKVHAMNLLYAKNYNIWQDFNVLIRYFNNKHHFEI